LKPLSIVPACPFSRKYCHTGESGGEKEKEEEDKHDSEKLWSFTEPHPAYRTVKSFFYINSIAKYDKQNTMKLESLLFHLKLTVPTNQLSITSFFGKKKFTNK
jgi:hypothetical protein